VAGVNDTVRYYRIADITIKVESDLSFKDDTFKHQIELFRVDGPGEDTVTIHHHFEMPDFNGQDLGKQVYHKAPWAIYQQPEGWLYLGILPDGFKEELWAVAIFNQDHSLGHIYHKDAEVFRKGNLGALTMFPTDQILIARLLADRQGCYLHSAGAIINGSGMLFVGHSEAGKSTITQMLMDAGARSPLQVEILCDDRNIIRYREDGWRVYGTWSHGDIPLVSPSFSPIKAICFLEKDQKNTLKRLSSHQEINRNLLSCVIKPLVMGDWWINTLSLLSQLISQVPCYILRFDKGGKVVEELMGLANKEIE
jgi:hypothetical protein